MAVSALQTAAMQTDHPVSPAIRIFVVENSPAIRERLIVLLAAVPGAIIQGYAERAAEAIDLILEQKPDAVVLDLNLTEGSGLHVLRVLQDVAPEIAVFVLTNYADAQYRRLCTRLGARGFFDKSTEFEKVRDAIAALAMQPVP